MWLGPRQIVVALCARKAYCTVLRRRANQPEVIHSTLKLHLALTPDCAAAYALRIRSTYPSDELWRPQKAGASSSTPSAISSLCQTAAENTKKKNSPLRPPDCIIKRLAILDIPDVHILVHALPGSDPSKKMRRV